MAARLDAPPADARPVTVTAPAHRAGLACPRRPAAAELATISAGYLGYALVRLAIHANRHAAFAHAAQLWQAERRMHLRIEPWLNRLPAAHPPLAEAVGYYYALLAGAAVAGTGSLALLAAAAGMLAAGTAALTAAALHAGAFSRWLSRRHHRSRAIAPLAAAVAGLSRQGAGFGWAAGVLARTVAGLLADAGLLAACFGLAGLPVPWRGLLFAYAAGQLAGRLVPLPGGLGALTLTGTRPAAAAAAVIVYRVAGYWAVGAAGTATAATRRRRSCGLGAKLPSASGLH
jgi:hypothetical protein